MTVERDFGSEFFSTILNSKLSMHTDHCGRSTVYAGRSGRREAKKVS